MMSGLRVLHWCPNYLGGGGVARAVQALAVAQAALGAVVAIAGARVSRTLYDRMDQPVGVTLIAWRPRWRVRLGRFMLRGIPREALDELRCFAPDIVHVHGEFNPDNLWVVPLFSCPIILSPHGGFHPEVMRRQRQPIRRLYLAMHSRLLHRRLAALHALSPMEQSHINGYVPGRAVYCVPQGPSVHATYGPGPGGRSRSGAVRFIFVGRLDVGTKGLDILLDAFDAATKLVGDRQLALTLVGPDWRGGLDWLRRRAADLGVADRVSFVGSVAGAEVVRRLREADVYVQLSRHEGLPLSIAEAMVVGRPVVMSAAIGTASYPEIASLPHVRVVPTSAPAAAEVMAECARQIEPLRRLACVHLAEVRAFFSWERCARAHIAAYESFGSAVS
jgi:glycosyltransferase involved in cell wall biosynthesis